MSGKKALSSAGEGASTSASTSKRRRKRNESDPVDALHDVKSKKDQQMEKKPVLPDDCWAKILESVDDFSVIAFVSVCRQLRRVQKRSGRELKKRIPQKLSNCTAAAAGGHLEILKYLHEKGFPWDYRTCRNAARHGHLEVLKYSHEKGCAWDEGTCSEAAKGGHLDVLKYAHENGCPEA